MINRPITIAGGGIAGLALGIALRRQDVPVMVMEASTYPRHRVCGEFISGLSQDDLTELGLGEVLTVASRHRSTSWYESERVWFRGELPAAAFGVSRHYLDEALASRFRELGGELSCGVRWDADDAGVVWANGRLRGNAGWLGLKAHYEDLELTDDLEIHLGDGGYMGLTRVENERVNVCGLFRLERITGDDPLIGACETAGFSGIARRLRAARKTEGSGKGVTHFALGWQSADPRRIAIGDAAAMIPPFTGNGMTMAIQSALAASQEIARWSCGEIEWDEAGRRVRREQRRRFGRRLRWARFFQGMMLRRMSRRLGMGILASGLISFKTLYHTVR